MVTKYYWVSSVSSSCADRSSRYGRAAGNDEERHKGINLS